MEETPGDLINDEVPSNLDYLDEAFGTSGGVTALSDEEDFGALSDEGPYGSSPSTPVDEPPETPPTANLRQETIDLLHPEGVNIIEDFYENITPMEDGLGPSLEWV